MSWSDVASLALAIFLILVGVGLFYLFFRLGGLFGQLDNSVEEITDETVPILSRVQVTVYEVTGSAPALAGGVKAIWAATLAGVAVPIVGAPGTVAAVNGAVAADAVLGPRMLYARTEHE